MLEKIFHLKENHTDVKTELMAGVTTFMTMAYILAVNPSILSASGMDANAVLIATSLASFVGTALMALLANYPFALAPGMGLNAYFSYTVVLTMGYSWQLALMAVFVEGIIFIVLSLTNVREAIFNAIPMTLKSAVSVGIGLFVAFVGLQNAKLIVNSDSTLVTYQHFKGATFHSVGVGAILALLGVVITAILLVKKVKGGILYGILITWVLGILCELTGIYIPNPDAGMYSVIPTAFVSFDFSALGKTFGQVFKTITVDNGSEFADWKGMQQSAADESEKRVTVFYCHPYCSFERGSNENQNRLVRRKIPKGENFDDRTEDDIQRVEDWINDYPREMFGWKTSGELFQEELARLA